MESVKSISDETIPIASVVKQDVKIYYGQLSNKLYNKLYGIYKTKNFHSYDFRSMTNSFDPSLFELLFRSEWKSGNKKIIPLMLFFKKYSTQTEKYVNCIFQQSTTHNTNKLMKKIEQKVISIKKQYGVILPKKQKNELAILKQEYDQIAKYCHTLTNIDSKINQQLNVLVNLLVKWVKNTYSPVIKQKHTDKTETLLKMTDNLLNFPTIKI